MRLRIIFGMLAALIMAASTAMWVSAQEATKHQAGLGKLTGIVKDRQDAAIAGVPIVFEGKIAGKKLRQKVLSNEDGAYEAELPPGLYRMTIKFVGFRRYQNREIKVETGKTTYADVVLIENNTHLRVTE